MRSRKIDLKKYFFTIILGMAVALLENGGYKPWLNLYANSLTLIQPGGFFSGGGGPISLTQSGQTLFATNFLLNSTINLPVPGPGWKVKIIFTDSQVTTGVVITYTATGPVLKGNLIVGSAAPPNNLVSSNHGPLTNIIYTASTATGINTGDYIEFASDGNFIYFTIFTTNISNLWTFS
jgi:hypothetical protein